MQVMVTSNRLPLVYDKSRPARFGVLPKRPKSGKEVRWFELPPGELVFPLLPFYILHAVSQSCKN